MSTGVLAPVAGWCTPLSEVPDPVFASEMVGSGVALEPTAQERVTAVAPISGRILKLHPHAYVILRADGVGVLVHIGIDTVKLDGEGFELIATEGSQVTEGDPIVSFDPTEIRARGLSSIVPVVVMDTKANAITQGDAQLVDAGAVIYNWPPEADVAE